MARIHFTMCDSADVVYVYETDCDENKALRRFENMVRYHGPFEAKAIGYIPIYHINPDHVTKWWLKP